MIRVDSQALPVSLDGVIVAVEVGVSGPKVVPGGGILRVDTDGLTVGRDGVIEVGVSGPKVVPGDGIFRVDTDGLTVGCDGVIGTLEVGVSGPKVVPGGDIFRVDTDGLTEGRDGVIVAVEVGVSEPKVVPGNGLFRPLPEPMNYLAASREVSDGTSRTPSEQSELLRMELGVLLLPSLGSNVPLDLAFAPVAADRADVVPVRPELPAPEGFLDRGHPTEDLAGRQALDPPHHLRRAVWGDRLHEKVHVVPIRPYLEERDLVARRDLQAAVPEHLVHVRRYHGAPVLGRTHDVVEQDGDIVAAVDMFTHALSVSQPDAVSRGVWTLNESNIPIMPSFLLS